VAMSFRDGQTEITVFEGLNFGVVSGKSLAIIGESGVGKTTLLYLLGGLEMPSKGEIKIGGNSITEHKGRGSELTRFRGENLGVIFQFHHLFAEFDALENVAMPLLVQRVSWSEARSRAKTLLEKVGLGKRLSHRPSMLSGGEQQRVAIARALVTKPGIVLADEPTGNLDVQTGHEVGQLLRQMHEELGITMVVVTHSHDLAKLMDSVVELTPSGVFERTL